MERYKEYDEDGQYEVYETDVATGKTEIWAIWQSQSDFDMFAQNRGWKRGNRGEWKDLKTGNIYKMESI